MRTLYVGGGTPTVLPSEIFQSLLRATMRGSKDLEEITTEANPGTLTTDSLRAMRQEGVNRISLGVQSLNDKELRLLGRIHDSCTALESIELIRSCGFDNLSLDLIYGLPGQNLSSWELTLNRVLKLEPEHLSLYALSIEPGTALADELRKGSVQSIDDDLVADMYELSGHRLKSAGYTHYEISNWALPGRECRHNLVYWRNEPYLGVGAGAWSYWQHRRWGNVRNPQQYINRTRAKQSVEQEYETVSLTREMSDTVILGLRLCDGVRWNEFRRRFGVQISHVYGRELESLLQLKLLEADQEGVRLTARGRLLANEVFEKFLVDP